MSKILITGVAGLLGNNLSRHFIKRGHKVVGIDDFSGGYKDLVHPQVQLYERNLVDDNAVSYIFATEKPDYVFHFAAYAAVGLSPFIRKHNYLNNVVASANIINACINYDVKKIIFASSMDVYGTQEPPFVETQQPRPEDPYGIAKYAIEQDLHAAGRLFGLKYNIVRPHNVFGVYQNIWDKYRNVIGIWIRQTLSGQPLTIYGEGKQIRSFSDVDFYMQPFEKLLGMCDGETFNIGADSYVSIAEAASRFQSVAKQNGFDTAIMHLEPRDEVIFAYCDHTKAKQMLDFKDDTHFENLVDKMIKWSLKQPVRSVKVMDYEIEKKMYSFWKK
jgi:UDP-glucose 4-epimerase